MDFEKVENTTKVLALVGAALTVVSISLTLKDYFKQMKELKNEN
jgi:hypothetical protein